MQQTQINIYNGRKQFRYGVEYVDNIESVKSGNSAYINQGIGSVGENIFQFVNMFQNSNIKDVERNTNQWSLIEDNDPRAQRDFIPDHVNLSSVNVYFPTYGVETYTGNWLYVFSAYTYINGDKIVLNETVLDRRNAISYPGKKEMNNIRYMEYINIIFPDPWELAYSDDWAPFRQQVCGEPANLNNTGSMLTIEIHPVKKLSDTKWSKLDNYLGGMNSLLLSNDENMTLTTLISYIAPSTIHLDFVYNGIYDSLEEYINETYKLGGSDPISLSSTLTLFDNENIYNIYAETGSGSGSGSGNGSENGIDFYIVPDPDDQFSTIKFNSWNEFSAGLQFKAVTEIKVDELPMLTLLSNSISVDQNMFAKILANEAPMDIDSVLSEFDNDNNTTSFNNMNTINIVNKTQKQIINIDKPNDFKNNLTRPVFIRTQASNSIVIHPSATENIAINLREYKNYVETFTLRIADVDFVEYGRQSSNVIFKVVGKQLPEEIENGIFYILDDNDEIITTGNYTLE